MIVRRGQLLLLVCNRCKAELPIAYGHNAEGITPEVASQQFTCLGWKTKGSVSACPKHSRLPALTPKAVLADFMNFLKLTGRKVILHPKDLLKDEPKEWAGSTIFGRKRAK